MINSLQSLRGIFAAFIFLHHLGLFAAGGDAGVSFFLVLSGFVMSSGYRGRILRGEIDYRTYLRRRFLRIYPLHLIGFVAAIVLTNCWLGRYTPPVWLANLLLLQSWVPEQTVYFSCDAPSWCLSDLFFLYALFPALARLGNRLSAKQIAGAMALLLGCYFGLIHLLPQSWWTPIIYINPLMRCIDFIIGMMLFSAVSRFRLPQKRSVATCLELIVAGVYALAVCGYYGVSERYGLASYWWLPSSLLIVVFAAGRTSGGVLSAILTGRPLLWFGNLSFVFYMMHMPIIKGSQRLLALCGHEVIPSQSPLFCIATFIVTLLLSALVNSRTEPWLRQKLAKTLTNFNFIKF